MLKREITFENFDGETVTETHYFNFTKTELIELQVEHPGGLEGLLQKIIETKDNKGLVDQFKRIVLLAYGVRSEDGKRFIKNDQVREEFTQTPAFDALFIELATSDDAASVFIKGVMPRDMQAEIAKADAAVVQLPPTPPGRS